MRPAVSNESGLVKIAHQCAFTVREKCRKACAEIDRGCMPQEIPYQGWSLAPVLKDSYCSSSKRACKFNIPRLRRMHASPLETHPSYHLPSSRLEIFIRDCGFQRSRAMRLKAGAKKKKAITHFLRRSSSIDVRSFLLAFRQLGGGRA